MVRPAASGVHVPSRGTRGLADGSADPGSERRSHGGGNQRSPGRDQGAFTVYRIADADLLVDALQFLHLVEEVKSRAVDQAVDLAEEARDLWRSPPPTFGDLPCPDPEAYEALGSAFQFLKAGPDAFSSWTTVWARTSSSA